jgi:hypothetical protein
MRRVVGLLCVLFVVNAVSAREREVPPRKEPPVLRKFVRFVKFVVGSLGDGIIVPIPGPKP